MFFCKRFIMGCRFSYEIIKVIPIKIYDFFKKFFVVL
jgi:hypothetical protein